MSETALRQYAADMYDQLNAFWSDHQNELLDGRCGFAILSGPPIYQPSVMIIGENPGFGAHDCEAVVEASWPEASYIPTADWKLAKKLRRMFGDDTGLGLLDNAMQTNFLFFKSSSISRDEPLAWANVDSKLRTEAQRLSLELLEGYVDRSEPRMVIVLGLNAFDRQAANNTTILRTATGRQRLLAAGQIFGRQAYGIPHPTGSYVSDADWERCVAEIRNLRPAV